MSTPSVQERIRTARNQSMEITVGDRNPTLLSVDAADSEPNYTVVPGAVYCSCQGHQLAPTVCEHMIAVLDTEGELSDLMHGVLAQHKNALEGDGRREEQQEIIEIFNELDLPQYAPSTVAEVIHVLEHY